MLSTVDQVRLSVCLGYPWKTFEQSFAELNSLNVSEVSEVVVDLLDKLDMIDDKLLEMSLSGNAKSIDDIKVSQAIGTQLLKKQGRAIIAKIAYLLNIEVAKDIYSSYVGPTTSSSELI